MNYTLKTIYLEEKDKKHLNRRKCDNCSNKLLRGKTEGLENWINRRFCCKTCMLKNRQKFGLVFHDFEYKCRKFNSDDNIYGLTIPSWFIIKYKLKSAYYSFECFQGKFIIYTKKKKGLKMMKLRETGMKGYYHIGIPIQIVRKYKLQDKLFKFEDGGKKFLCYMDTKGMIK